jgi:hypothetical protein
VYASVSNSKINNDKHVRNPDSLEFVSFSNKGKHDIDNRQGKTYKRSTPGIGNQNLASARSQTGNGLQSIMKGNTAELTQTFPASVDKYILLDRQIKYYTTVNILLDDFCKTAAVDVARAIDTWT